MSTLTLRPNADNDMDIAVWKGTGGVIVNLYSHIDEVTLDTADYVYMAGPAVDYKCLFSFPDHTSESGTINSVTVKAYLKMIKTGGPISAGSVSIGVKMGGTAYYGSTFRPSDITVTLYSQAWNTNPDTSAAWTWTNIDALIAGVKGTAISDKYGSDYPYKYQCWAEVDYTSGWSNIAKVNGISSASIAKVNGIVVASIAKLSGKAV